MPWGECLFQDGQEAFDCEVEVEGRAMIQRILELKQELKVLEDKLRNHPIVDSIEKTRKTEWKDHWFTAYMEQYHQ
jgi:hypothetical protein